MLEDYTPLQTVPFDPHTGVFSCDGTPVANLLDLYDVARDTQRYPASCALLLLRNGRSRIAVVDPFFSIEQVWGHLWSQCGSRLLPPRILR